MLTIRPARGEDAETLGRICYEAFAAIASAHNFPPDFPNPDIAIGLMKMLTASPRAFGVVAEVDGEIAGSNFMTVDDTIFGIGPITIAPGAQNSGAGAGPDAHGRERNARVGNFHSEAPLCMARGEAMEQRAHNIRLLLSFGFLLAWPTLAAAGPCYDLSKGQPAALTGTLDFVVFPGPPNYKNVQKGDTPEPSFVLRLAHPICVQGDKSADPKMSFRAVQLAKTAKVEGKLKPLLHQPVAVTLQHPATDKAHREAPLFAWVTGIAARPMEPAKAHVPAPPTHPLEVAKAPTTAATKIKPAKDQRTAATTHNIKPAKEQRIAASTHNIKPAKDKRTAAITHPVVVPKQPESPAIMHRVEFTKERKSPATTGQVEATAHETAATTVRAFYGRLADGRGDIASAMVVPHKRAQGPFSADELTRFYGHLKEPLTLRNVEANGQGEFLVHYRYAASARECNGRALVKTVVLEGKSYIKSIDALDGC